MKDVNISINHKEIVGIVGESGKSTLIRAILGILPTGSNISSGNIIFKDRNLLEYSEKEWSGIRGNRILLISRVKSLDKIE